MDIVQTILNVFSGVFGFFSDLHSYTSTFWWLLQVLSDFGNWVIGAIGWISALFA